MEKFKKLVDSLIVYSFFWLVLACSLTVGVFLLCNQQFELSLGISAAIALASGVLSSLLVARLTVLASTQAFRAVWQAVWHVSPNGDLVPAPKLGHITHGREVAEALNSQVYDLASSSPTKQEPSAPPSNLSAQTPVSLIQKVNDNSLSLAELLPIPVIALDKNGNISFANKLAASYCGLNIDEMIGKSFASCLQMSFQNDDTLEKWVSQVTANSVSAHNSWDRVKLTSADGQTSKLFDLFASYNKDNSSGYETLLAIFDHTSKYSSEDDSTSYVAMAVHELRTPLTILRGYIEVFDDQLGSSLSPELKAFMSKMSASAQNLTALVSNILNVSRVDENQLNLTLQEADWNEVLTTICKDLELRVKVRGKVLELDLAQGLPAVAVDKISIYEVVSNLVDNAVKYSPESTKIIIHSSLGKDGSIETVVQDFGIGVPENAIPHLFSKFYRSHRSGKRVGGSGLGLYLVKAIVVAHGGHVWVSSKEGEGSSFGFSLQPFSAVKDELSGDSSGIEREAHGWIKNHSIYRK